MQPRKFYVKPIKQEIIDWFLNRALNNYDYLKDLPEEEIDQRIAALDPVPRFKLPLFKEQKIMFLIGAIETNYTYWSGIGTGKTALSLELINYRYQKDKPSLVFALDEQNISNWLVECHKFVPHLKVLPILGTKDKRQKLIQQPADIYILSYSSIRSLFSTGKSALIAPINVVNFAKRFKTIIYDEIVEAKCTQSVTFQVCKLLSQNIPYRYGLTGRPFGRQSLDLWSQFFLIDLGESLGKHQEIFKQTFFRPKITPFTIIWTPNDARKDDFARIAKNKAIYFPEVALPPPIRVPISIDMSDEAKVYYRKLRGDLIADFKVDTWHRNIKNPFVKFRQICSGFLNVKDTEIDPDTGKEIVLGTTELVFANAKEHILKKIVSLLPIDRKMIIFYEFTPSGKRINKVLDELRVRHVWLWGQAQNKSELLEEFKNDPRCRILVANIDSGGTGLNLQVANYLFYYENSDDAKARVQSEGRVWRRGQEKQVYIYDVIIKNSIEEKILKFHIDSQQLFDELVTGKVSKRRNTSFFKNIRSQKEFLNAIGDLGK